MTTPLVIKLGGRVLVDTDALAQLLPTIARLAKLRALVLVHGGGDQVQLQLQQLGFTSVKTAGQRITPAEHIPIVAGVLAGDLNSQLCALAQQHQLNPVGLTLFAGDSIRCSPDAARGAVGVPAPGNPQLLELLIDRGFIPVLSSIGISASGERLNVNADLAAGAVAQLLHADLILLTDVPGILDARGALIELIQADQADQLIADGTVRDGMLVKLNAAVQAARASRRSIAVAGWQDATALTRLAKGEAAGTRIRL
ncbi:acetylglutamate kinase [Pseudidiomarina salinarum]|uniref:Acetylglutamate kinase n=1 Tax=Pseudidiomarina salinarum TaxID=435908 RepID=A0A094IXZ1_9GAMM|nr:acetylglutamate kinase [Pseudidiomarina salinarum]KFZ30689.1 acetylglutamate kinase [Pseudidiomarina salinarum]RUO69209.1 acetylglutamate kinase [Pseudidiomarina salinarum]